MTAMTTKRTTELRPHDIIRVAGRLRKVSACVVPADGHGTCSLYLDPPLVELPLGASLDRPGDELWEVYDSLVEPPPLSTRQEVALTILLAIREQGNVYTGRWDDENLWATVFNLDYQEIDGNVNLLLVADAVIAKLRGRGL